MNNCDINNIMTKVLSVKKPRKSFNKIELKLIICGALILTTLNEFMT